MSITFFITANTAEEFDILESEGAPETSMSNGAGQIVAEWFTGVALDDVYAGQIDPEEALTGVEGALALARERDAVEGQVHVLGVGWVNGWERRVENVVEVLKGARALGRTVSWG